MAGTTNELQGNSPYTQPDLDFHNEEFKDKTQNNVNKNLNSNLTSQDNNAEGSVINVLHKSFSTVQVS